MVFLKGDIKESHDNLQAASRLVDEAYNLVESIKDPRLSTLLKNLAKDQAGLDVLAASGESMITEGFIAALEDEFSKLGWYMFKLFGHHAQWAIIHADALDKTIKLGLKRVMSYQDLPIEELYKLYQALLAK